MLFVHSSIFYFKFWVLNIKMNKLYQQNIFKETYKDTRKLPNKKTKNIVIENLLTV